MYCFGELLPWALFPQCFSFHGKILLLDFCGTDQHTFGPEDYARKKSERVVNNSALSDFQ
jgi:hypothetical protein